MILQELMANLVGIPLDAVVHIAFLDEERDENVEAPVALVTYNKEENIVVFEEDLT